MSILLYDKANNLVAAKSGEAVSAEDFDGDGLANGAELAAGADPWRADSDGDGLNDAYETSHGLKPNSADSDNDGLPDQWETDYGLDAATVNALGDPDGDGLNNLEEYIYGSNPLLCDSDNDTLEDGAEVHEYRTNPASDDSDADGCKDNEELEVSQTIGMGAAFCTALLEDRIVWWSQYPLETRPDYRAPGELLDNQGQRVAGAMKTESGYRFGLVVKDGRVWAWGINNYGQLGNGTKTDNDTASVGANALTPVLNESGTGYLTNVAAVAVGERHGLALTKRGDVFAWGANPNKELGQSSCDYRTLPTRVTGKNGIGWLTNVVAISAGGFHSLAVLKDGTVVAWGDNDYGQLGNNGSGSDVSVPTVVGGALAGLAAKAVSGGTYHSLVLLRDGRVFAWGKNTTGQLGLGYASGMVASPAQVLGPNAETALSGMRAIAAGPSSSIALSGDGQVLAWGDNARGQLGDGARDSRYRPGYVKDACGGNLSEVVSIAHKAEASLVLKRDRSVWMWGYNSVGFDGSGTYCSSTDTSRDRLLPCPVGSMQAAYHPGTDPTKADTDGDGMPDGWEIANKLDPVSAVDALVDADLDGLSNLLEYKLGSNPRVINAAGSGLGAEEDKDGDGMPNAWELRYGLDASHNDAAADADRDGLSNLTEYQEQTDPTVRDTDYDGLNDRLEVDVYFSNPLLADSDADALTDYDEIYRYETLPNNADSDDDLLKDGEELAVYGTNPKVPDTDADGATDGYEVLTSHTDPLVADKDVDGMNDGWELNNGLNPNDAGDAFLDSDEDGLNNLGEFMIQSNPNAKEIVEGRILGELDFDSDGMPNAWELSQGFDLKRDDSGNDADEDGLANGQEYTQGCNPHDNDTDDDQLTDGQEVYELYSNPLVKDTDGDALEDGAEHLTHRTSPIRADTDGDGLPDGEEVNRWTTSPLSADTDGDGLTDWEESRYFQTLDVGALQTLVVTDKRSQPETINLATTEHGAAITCVDGYDAEKAIDEDVNTVGVASIHEGYFLLDLKQEYLMYSNVVYTMGEDNWLRPHHKLYIQASVTGEDGSWTTILPDGYVGSSVTVDLNPPMRVRYLRLVGTGNTLIYAPQNQYIYIKKWQVYGCKIEGVAKWWGCDPVGGTPSAPTTFVNGAELGGILSLSAGTNHHLALLDDETVRAWGQNEHGQLGDGTREDRLGPTLVKGLEGAEALTNVISVAAGYTHSLALLRNGSVCTWGANELGQLGVAAGDDRLTPVGVTGESGQGVLQKVKAVAAGEAFSLALLSSGEVLAWGGNAYGQLGNNAEAGGYGPAHVMDSSGALYLNDVLAIAAGRAHGVALRADGSVWTWGRNQYGQLGAGSGVEYSRVPVRVKISETEFLAEIRAIASGGDHTLALRKDGSVWAWGYNAGGQLGQGDETDRSFAAQVLAPGSSANDYLGGMSLISCHLNGSAAVGANGQIHVWGLNDRAQLGSGEPGEGANRPVELAGQTLSLLRTLPTQADTDHDGMSDGWEIRYGFNPLVDDGNQDADGDGFLNITEFTGRSDPRNPASVIAVPPQFDSAEPDGISFEMDEEQIQTFLVHASDRNGDTLSYVWKLDGCEQDGATGPSWSFTPDSNGSGYDTLAQDHTVEAIVIANGDRISHTWQITVNNRNHTPVLQAFSPMTVKVGNRITLTPVYSDPDNENLSVADDNTLTVSYSDWMTKATRQAGRNDIGQQTVTVTVRDHGNPELQAQQTVQITVLDYEAVDTDGDGMYDGWETDHGLDPNSPDDGEADSDEDGLVNYWEWYFGTDPDMKDTDGDLWSDFYEALVRTDGCNEALKPAANLLTNGNFETTTGWANLNKSYLGLRTERANDGIMDGYSGKYLFDGTRLYQESMAVIAQRAPILGQCHYLFHADIKSDGREPSAFQGIVAAYIFEDEQGVVTGVIPLDSWLGYTMGNTARATLVCRIFTPRDVDKIDVYLTTYDGSCTKSAGTIWWDNVTLAYDLDDDRLEDAWEVEHGLDPLKPDTDSDGMSDAWETVYGLDALHDDAEGDSDGDGLLNIDEYLNGTNPRLADTDGDTMNDRWEVDNNLNPKNSSDADLDADSDGYSNATECDNGTNPRYADTHFVRVKITDLSGSLSLVAMNNRSDIVGTVVDGAGVKIDHTGAQTALNFIPIDINNLGLMLGHRTVETAAGIGEQYILNLAGTDKADLGELIPTALNDDGLVAGYVNRYEREVLAYYRNQRVEVQYYSRVLLNPFPSLWQPSTVVTSMVFGTPSAMNSAGAAVGSREYTIQTVNGEIHRYIDAYHYAQDDGLVAIDASGTPLTDFIPVSINRQGAILGFTHHDACALWIYSGGACTRSIVLQDGKGMGCCQINDLGYVLVGRTQLEPFEPLLPDTIGSGENDYLWWESDRAVQLRKLVGLGETETIVDARMNDVGQIALVVQDGDCYALYLLTADNRDADGDGVMDYQEYLDGTPLDSNGILLPTADDVDGDGLPNTYESSATGTSSRPACLDPLKADQDQDGLPDGWEWNPYAWAWNSASHKWEQKSAEFDRMNDWFADGSVEASLGIQMSPCQADAYGDDDQDGLWNLTEYRVGTKPYSQDSDEDGLSDYREIAGGGGGESACMMAVTVTDPNNPDTDGDDLTDGYEINALSSDPLDAQSGMELFDEWRVVDGAALHSLFIRDDDSVWACGDNTRGQLGDGTTVSRSTPAAVPGLVNIVEVDGEQLHSLALDANGQVYVWGDNYYGDLGIGTSGDYKTQPQLVAGLPPMKHVAAGYYHNLGLTPNGEVWAWGSGWDGELGVGIRGTGTQPVKLNLDNVVAIAAGARHSMALKSDGTVYCWGRNDKGQIGDGTTVNKAYPTQVEGLPRAVAIADGIYFSMALCADGTVWAWGNNTNGQLGVGSTVNSPFPVQVQIPNQEAIVAIDAGYHMAMALTASGQLLVWGAGGNGQLGNNSTTDSLLPIPLQVGAGQPNPCPDANLTLGAGGWHNLLMGGDGAVYSWGVNHNGQLGYTTTFTHRQPVKKILGDDTDGDGMPDF